MTDKSAEEDVRALLARAGVAVGGGRPWDIRVRDPGFYKRVLSGGSLAAGEAYVDGWWESDRLDEFFHRVFKAGLYERVAFDPWARLRIQARRIFDAPSAGLRAGLGNDLFRAMLGERMSSSCAYWKDARDLDEAQDAKMELVCRKLELKPGLSVLDLGCGWGAFARYAAERHGVSVVGVDIAEEQVTFGRERCRGLAVALRVQDHREVRGRYDRVVSIGLMEHVAPRNWRSSMAAAARCLKADGIALVHAVARNVTDGRLDPWLDRNVFPGGAAPSLSSLAGAMEGSFVAEDVHNIGPHYDPTLLAWHENLSRRWPELRGKYGDRLYRALKFCLLASAGGFRARRSQLFQIVMTRPGRVQPACRAEPARAARLKEGGEARLL
ncbi:MAG: cyclopropane fatty acyl phospholipid synthase [Elusimicrobiota bacterium]|nr:cyclopropane fatty acyl phospholipid synthase [Elusimicrobiota bacterium]